jgi:hypothetical protein
MNNKEVLEFILEIENRMKKIDSQYEKYFLLTRMFLYGEFRGGKKGRPTSLFNSLRYILKDIVDIFKFGRQFDKQNVIFVPEKHFNLSVDGKFLSKHVEALSSKVDSVGVVSLGRNRSTQFSVTSIMAFLYKINFFSLNNKLIKSFVSDFELVLHDVKVERCANCKVKSDFLFVLLSKFDFYAFFYNKIIPKNVNLRRSYFIAYYNVHSFSLIETLKTRGVECIDYQHGIQNNFHPMYAFLSNVSNSFGLPDVFWGWDDVSKKRILSELSSSHFKKVGNLWYETELYKKLMVTPDSSKRNILVALQQWPDFFNFDLLKVIEDDVKYQWIFREHPLNKIPIAERNWISEKYKNIFFEDVGSTKVEVSIKSCEICITGFSTVGIEAYHMNKKVIFTHENALLGLSDYIDHNHIFYADSYETIKKIID